MAVIRIERIEDPRLDDYRNVSDGERLRRRNLFVGEGRLVVRRLLSSAHAVASLLLNESSFASLSAEFGPALDAIPVYVGPTAQLAQIVGFNLHRGCLALAERPAERAADEITREAELLLVLENVTDADNVGSAFRNAAAFGVDGVLLSACCDPLYRKALRTSVGHVLNVPFAHVSDLVAQLSSLKSHGCVVLALTPRDDATRLSEFAASRSGRGRIAMLVGNERDGLTAGVERVADIRVRIPMHRGVDSLNLSTAIGIALDRLTNV